MQKILLSLTTSLLFVPLLFFVGCGKSEDVQVTNHGPIEMSEDPPSLPTGGEHNHPTEGPHHGDLIELGNEQYHAELLHPEKGETSPVTIYVLDGTATKQVAIDAADITINIQHEGKPEQFKLAASPDKDDPEGKSSRFTSSDADLIKHFAESQIQGRLVIKTDGKQFNGEIRHDHSGHNHSH